ncbi:MAG: C4-dicarboxylate transporter permease, partial [Deltaproteobacteria bacterium]|nr:C4-dicarboxylate transporter permease [Deltaproteobacteria bacterium]
MSPETIGLLGIALLLFLFFLGLPISFSMAFVGFVGLFFLNSPQSALNTLAQDYFDTLSSYPLSVIPTFILMGSFAYASGISQKLYAACYTWFGALRGGLTIATVVACSGFAAVCGSTAATAATMGKIAIPE